MGEPYLTTKEIDAKYPNEWVLVDQLKKDRHKQLLGGTVLFHSTDRGAVTDFIQTLPDGGHLAVWYTGPIAEDVIFLL